MKILFHCLMKTYDAERQYIIYAHSNNKHEAEKQHTKKGEKYFSAMVCLIIHCYEAHCTYKDHECASACIADKAASCSPLTACHVFSAEANTCRWCHTRGTVPFWVYSKLSASIGHSQISPHSSCQPLIIYYESCSIKIKQTPGNYEWDEHTEKPNSNTVFYKPGYFKVLKITRNLII